MKKYMIYFLLLANLFLLTGCWDSEENARMLYLHGVGLDYKDGQFYFYMQLVSFANVARSEQINQDVMQSEVGLSTGRTVDEAIAKMIRSVDEKIFFGHLTFLVFGEELLKQEEKLNEVLNSFSRYINTRYQTWIYATNEPLEQFFLETPLLKKAITLTKLANPLNSYEQDSFIEPMNVRKLIIHLNEPNHLVKIPYVRVKHNWNTVSGPDTTFHIEGVALVTPKEFKGYLIKDDANGLQFMTNESITGYVTTKIGDADFTFTIKNMKRKITPIVKGTDVKFQIDISADALVSSYNINVSEDAIAKAVEKGIEKAVTETYKKGLEKNCDVYRLSESLYRKNVKVWKKLENQGVIPLTEDSIDVQVTVQKVKSGRTIYKNTLKKPD